MRKPSIFSRDYEKKMRKRREIIMIFSVMTFFLLGFAVAAITAKSIDFSNARARVQRWIDNDTVVQSNDVEVEEPQKEIEQPKPPEIKTLNLKVNEQKVVNIEYEEVNSEVKFKEVKQVPSDIYYSINSNKNLILTIDEKQNLKIFNVKGEEKILTKESYTAPNGEVFTKDSVLANYLGYLWHKDARFLSDNKIVYISNVPYFGSDLNKYIWVMDLGDKSMKTLWASKGKEIKFEEYKDKGLEVQIDGNIKYINSNGELIN